MIFPKHLVDAISSRCYFVMKPKAMEYFGLCAWTTTGGQYAPQRL